MKEQKISWRLVLKPSVQRFSVSPEENAVVSTAAYRAASFDLRLTWVAILQNSPTYFHAAYLSTLLGLKSEF